MTHTELREQIKAAMKARAEVRLSVLRGLLSNATNELVAKGKKPTDELSEEDLNALIRRGAKQRKDSIEQFEKGGRADLADKEKEELAILDSFLPALMNKQDVQVLATAKAAELGITDKTKANQLMGMLMKDLKGKADGNVVKEVVDGMFA
ncbi:MAG: GatB/YqeY domain-containing protein [Candidatus Adlerbacteria bacterium]|nr:GatB/YqeY domain-containing protein [Candidatus Adlerbacteria bacterium]